MRWFLIASMWLSSAAAVAQPSSDSAPNACPDDIVCEPDERCTCHFDSNGRLARVDYALATGARYRRDAFYYDGEGRVVRRERLEPRNGRQTVASVLTSSYAEAGHLAQVSERIHSAVGSDTVITRHFAADGTEVDREVVEDGEVVPGSPAAPESAPCDFEQPVLFEVYHVNWAWGFQLTGSFIDGQGRVWRFDHGGDEWTDPPDGLTAADFPQRYGTVTHVRDGLDCDALAGFLARLPEVAGGGTRREHRAHDAGSTVFSGYTVDPSSGRYRRVDAHVDGDWRVTNTSEAARELRVWLELELSE